MGEFPLFDFLYCLQLRLSFLEQKALQILLMISFFSILRSFHLQTVVHRRFLPLNSIPHPKKKILIIVESPAKARTIEKFLDRNIYIVESSRGHIRGLPQSTSADPVLKKSPILPQLGISVASMGIDVYRDFKPLYVTLDGCHGTVRRLQTLAKSCSAIVLATDDDREGEAISTQPLSLTIPLSATPILTPTPIPMHRAVFHEITAAAVTHAFASPRSLDMDLVRAQEARRLLDRLTGFTLSPLLHRHIQLHATTHNTIQHRITQHNSTPCYPISTCLNLNLFGVYLLSLNYASLLI